MNRKLLLVVMGLVCLLPQLLFAQSNEANLKKYWENRDRLRKYFVKIGPNQGESLIANIRDPLQNNMRYSDATTQLGFYIAVLASEYELLKRNNQPTTGTLNELYFAIRAVKRLDKNGEVHYAFKLKGDVVSPQENGWFIRDDIDENFYQNWSNMGVNKTHSDYYNTDANAATAYFSPGNEPSQDQLFSLLMGFVFVKKYVGSIYVDPLGNGTGFNLQTEVQNIARRMRDYLLLEKFSRANEFDGPVAQGNFIKQNYTFSNPIYHWDCMDQHDNWVVAMAWPMMTIIESITGEGVDHTARFMVNHWTGDQYPSLSFESLKDIYEDIVETIPSTLPCIHVFNKDICVPESNYAMIMRFIMMSEAVGGMWSGTDELLEKSSVREQPIYYLMGRVLANQSIPSWDQIYYKMIIDAMPLCDGCYLYSQSENSTNNFSGFGGDVWSHDNYWIKNDLNDHDWSKLWIKGNQPGLDYMLFYNLYHLAFANSQNLPTYTPEVSCPCKSAKFPQISNSVNNSTWDGQTEIILPEDNQPNLTTTRIVKKYSFDYTGYGINLERYLIREVNIQGGVLDLREDVKVCNNAKTHLNSNGKIIVGNTSTSEPVVFRYTKGTELNIQNNGILEIQDNSRVIIEEGAKITFDNGASIQLNGTNAVLEIRGLLDIKANATFQTSGDGYVLFNIKNADASISPYNIKATSTSKMVFENPVGSPKTTKLKVEFGTILFPHKNLQMFRVENAGVLLLGEKVGIKLEPSPSGLESFQINNSYVEGGTGFTFAKLTFRPVISHNVFYGCKRALSFIGEDKGRDVKIIYNQFDHCDVPLVVYETGAHIAGNKFTLCGASTFGSQDSRIAPVRAGLYRGPLRMELNKFDRSTAAQVVGSYYPLADIGGNVVTYPAVLPSYPVLNNSEIYYSENVHSTLKCNYFENVVMPLSINSAGSLNMSTQQQSFRYSIHSNSFITGGNNIFNHTRSSIYLRGSSNIYGPNYYLEQGQNSFLGDINKRLISLDVERYGHYMGYGALLDANDDLVINGNYWAPVDKTSSDPSYCIEPNGGLHSNRGKHFKIKENVPPNFIVGTNVAQSLTCPLAFWNDAVSDPANFDPLVVSAFGYNYGSANPFKTDFDRPFGLDGTFGNPTTFVGSGVFNGQQFGTAFNNGLNGTTEPHTDENENTRFIPKPAGLISMANLLTNTAHHELPSERSIFGFGYQMYLNCLSKAAALNVFSEDGIEADAQVNAALAVFSAMETHAQEYEATEPERYYNTKLSVGIDKCHLYRYFHRYQEAQTVLAGLSSFVNTEDVNTISYLDCHVENEKKYFNGEISFVDYERNITSCAMLYGTDARVYEADSSEIDSSESGGGSGSNPAITYIIAPNPATTLATVNMTLNIDGYVKIVVFNKYGIQVKPDIILGSLTAGAYSSEVSLTGLTADVYNMVVYHNNIPYVQHFVKLTE